ncbi:MAG: carbon-nitrogen hydrolase family protein [Gemmatimonadota bacterium]|nr:carbon-nitrogen hydrolase family protein [Gemmatimonadota bacterium]
MKSIIPVLAFLLILLPGSSVTLFGEAATPGRTAKIAVIQVTALPSQDLFVDYKPAKVQPQMMAHFEKLLGLIDQAGSLGADLVCGPEDMQHIGGYGLHVDVTDPVTGEILFTSLATPVPGPLTDKCAKIARKHSMYIIAPLYERDGDKVYNTAVLFDRQGRIIGKHRKTLVPVMETWLVDTGDELEVFQTDFARIAIATCWELFYPEITTVYALKGADIVFNPTMARDNESGKSLSTAHTYITRARDNSVYIAPVILGTDGNGIIDFNGKVAAEAVGEKDKVIIAEIDFSKPRTSDSRWWTTINGTDNAKAIHYLSRRPDLYELLTDPTPPVLEQFRDVRLTTGDRPRQLKAVRAVDYGKK